MTCKKVMIVDDDADIRSTLSDALEIEGYEVLLAKDGLDALTVLLTLPAQSLPGFILLDVQMPRMDGITFLNEAQKLEAIKNIPVVIFTAKGRDYDKDLLPLKVDKVRKPLELDTLYSLVEKYCR